MEELLPRDLLDRAKPPLAEAHKKLHAAAEEAGEATVQESQGYRENFNFLDGEICKIIDKNGGAEQGVKQNARNGSENWVRRAIACKYKVDDLSVQKKLAYFLIMEASEGWKDKDTTGTLIGEFLGQWRGM